MPSATLPVLGKLSPSSTFDFFDLQYFSKRTDFISAVRLHVNKAYLVTPRFLEIWETLNCAPYQVFDTEVRHRGKSYPYKVIYSPWAENHLVDLQKSTFDKFENFGGAPVEMGVPTPDDADAYRLKYNALEHYGMPVPHCTHIKLKPEAAQFDFFRVSPFSVRAVVSERFKQTMEAAGITGMQFKLAEGAYDQC